MQNIIKLRLKCWQDKRYEDIHIAGSKEGCQSLFQIIDDFKKPFSPSKVKIRLNDDSFLNNKDPCCGFKVKQIFKYLEIEIVEDNKVLEWSIYPLNNPDNTIFFIINKFYLQEIWYACWSMCHGAFDFNLGGQDKKYGHFQPQPLDIRTKSIWFWGTSCWR